MSKYVEILRRYYPFPSFRKGQQYVIDQVAKKRDVIALFPTGYGKTLCYEVPTYVHGQTTLIISPLLSLMDDQVARLKMRGEKSVIAFNSMLTYEERQKALQNIKQYRFIFISPEMLNQPNVIRVLETLSIGLIAIDEAHCISQWGFDFRPDYLLLAPVIERLGRPPILALTATANDTVVRDIAHFLSMKDEVVYRHSLDRKNLMYRVEQFENRADKEERLAQLVLETISPGIIYMSSRIKTEQFAMQMRQRGCNIESYHAGKSVEDRQIIQEQFMRDEIDWIVATTAFGMGIDKPNVRQVIHEQMPPHFVAYIQEIGRAGRDNEEATVTLLYTRGDEENASYLIERTLPTDRDIQQYFIDPQQFVEEEKRLLIEIYEAYCQKNEACVQQQIEALRKQKKREIMEMYRYVQETVCYRRNILSAFDEMYDSTLRRCCSLCGDIPLEKKKKERKMTYDDRKWKERIYSLLD